MDGQVTFSGVGGYLCDCGWQDFRRTRRTRRTSRLSSSGRAIAAFDVLHALGLWRLVAGPSSREWAKAMAAKVIAAKHLCRKS